MTKKQLLNAPDYTHICINGTTWIKHGSRLHRGNYYNSKSQYIDINSSSEEEIKKWKVN